MDNYKSWENWDNKLFFQEFCKNKTKNTIKKWCIDNIIILHGWGGSSRSWDNIANKFMQDGYKVFVPDLPWFGKTKINKVFTVDGYSELIEDFIKYLNIDNIILLWHSNGGRIAINIAKRWNIHIKKLILNNAACIKHTLTYKQKASKILSKLLKIFSFVPGYNFIRKYFYKLIWWHDYLNLDNKFIKKTFLNMINSDLKQSAKNIKVNTLLVWWKNDTYTPLKDWQILNKLIKNSKLKILENERHWIHLQNPDRLYKTIINRLNK